MIIRSINVYQTAEMLRRKGAEGMRKRTAALLCALLMTAEMLGGCKSTTASKGELVTMSQEEIQSSLSYNTTVIEPPEGVELGKWVEEKNGIWYSIRNNEKTAGDKTSKKVTVTAFTEDTVLYSAVLLDTFADPDTTGNADGFFAADNGVYVVLSTTHTDPVSGTSTKKVSIISLSQTGEKTAEYDITEGVADREVKGLIVTPDGKFFLDLGKGVSAVFSADGTFEFKATIDTLTGNIINSNSLITTEGSPALCFGVLDDSFNVEMYVLDMEKQKFGKKRIIKSGGNAYTGSGEYSYYLTSETGIVGVRSDGTTENVVNLLNLGVDASGVRSFSAHEDGSFILSAMDLYKNLDSFIVKISPVNGDTKERTVITLGCFELPLDFASKIADFNRSNPDYVVVVSSYSDNTGDDDTASLIDFNNQLMSGNVPDIVVINYEMPYDSYVSKGMFADIYEFMDKDSDVSRGSFLENALKACERDGKLYSIFPTYYVGTCAAKKSIVGGDGLLTMEEAKKLLPADGAVSKWITRDRALEYAVIYSGLIDYEHGTCNFDTPEFASLLTEIRDLPTDVTYPQVEGADFADDANSFAEGRLLVDDLTLFMPSYFHNQRQSLVFGDDIAFVNFPTCEPTTNAVMYTSSLAAISQGSENKEGAWEFLKYSMLHNLVSEQFSYFDGNGNEVLLDEYYYYCLDGYPVYRKEYDELMKTAMTPRHHYDENGNYVEDKRTTRFIGTEVELPPLSEEELAHLESLWLGTTTLYRQNASVDGIIKDEANAFFSGTATAEQAAANIQSRISIYLSEQFS